jgi:hypothetical protein
MAKGNVGGSHELKIWDAHVRKLWDNKHLLTVEEEEIIRKITDRLP